MIARRHRVAALRLMVTLSIWSFPAQAAVPTAVEAMIREAAASHDKATYEAVMKVAKATNPDDADAIEALGAGLFAEAQARAKREEAAHYAQRNMFEGWKGEGQAGFGLTSGNTKETSAILGVSLMKEGPKTRHKLTGLVDYLRSNGTTTRQKYAASYALNYIFRDGLYLVSTLGWERDVFASYARRFTESLGLGYRAINRDHMTLDLEAGPALRQTRYTGGLEEDEFAGRASMAYRWTLRDGIALSEDGSVLAGGENTTLISTTALTAKINTKLSGRISYNVQHETSPAAGRQPTDTATRATLVYSF